MMRIYKLGDIKLKNVFSIYETQILTKYIYGSVVQTEDERILDQYAKIGFVSFGFNWDKMNETAWITPLGLDHL